MRYYIKKLIISLYNYKVKLTSKNINQPLY